MIDAGIVGASGYGGGELLRLLSRHPGVNLRVAASETYAGKLVSAAFPGMAKQSPLRFSRYEDGVDLALCDVVFLAQENGKAMQLAPHLLEAGIKIIDLSADFRFTDPDEYQTWYGMPHACPEWNAKAVYGLPEKNRDRIKGAQVVGNPGCYPTASLLALLPLLEHHLIRPDSVLVDAKSGVSGAGRANASLDYRYSEANESVSAYKIAGTHRHTGEIEQTLSDAAGQPLRLTFTPHLIPMTRGILSTCYGTLLEPISVEELNALYTERYADEPFVAFSADHLPATKHTLGTNMCHLGLAVDTRTQRVTVISAIDNLVKGAAGQAIQNMNLMCGLEETVGLDFGGIWP